MRDIVSAFRMMSTKPGQAHNQLFGYNTTVDKLNHDLRNLFNAYEELKSTLLNGRIDAPTYWTNCRRMGDQMKIVARALEVQEEEAKQLLCRMRVQARQDQPWTGRLTVRLIGSRGVSGEALARERVKLDREIEATKVKSGATIKEQLLTNPSDA